MVEGSKGSKLKNVFGSALASSKAKAKAKAQGGSTSWASIARDKGMKQNSTPAMPVLQETSDNLPSVLPKSPSVPPKSPCGQSKGETASPGKDGNRRASVHMQQLIRSSFATQSDSLSDFLSEDLNTQNDWEDGVAVIESILNPDSAAHEVLSIAQLDGLRKVQQLLLGDSQGGHNSMHIPKGLLEDFPEEGTTNDYILSQFAGIKRQSGKKKVMNVIKANTFIRRLQLKADSSKLLGLNKEALLLPEWSLLPQESRAELSKRLTWDNLLKWDFDVFEITRLTRGRPLLFIGWAIMASPFSQYAMKQAELPGSSRGLRYGGDGINDALAEMEGYGFIDQFKVPQECLINFLRSIEKEYDSKNPYHNHIHAADVLQSLHSILSGMNARSLASGELEIFSLLIAAIIHDVGHPGRNNSFQVNSKSELAIEYNDVSVLENMHAAKAFKRLSGSGLDPSMNIFKGMSNEQWISSRKMIIECVLDTDMTKHFSTLSKIKGIRINNKEKKRFDDNDAWQILHFALHLADISNPAKPTEMALQWTDRCLDEFFEQGDEERRMGLPISPLCCRSTTQRADSQVGFIKFVVQPAFKVLAKIVPDVGCQVLPILEENLTYWEEKLVEEGQSLGSTPSETA